MPSLYEMVATYSSIPVKTKSLFDRDKMSPASLAREYRYDQLKEEQDHGTIEGGGEG